MQNAIMVYPDYQVTEPRTFQTDLTDFSILRSEKIKPKPQKMTVKNTIIYLWC